jgi:hypothetical protein
VDISEPDNDEIIQKVLQIPQLIAPGIIEEKAQLPSFFVTFQPLWIKGIICFFMKTIICFLISLTFRWTLNHIFTNNRVKI